MLVSLTEFSKLHGVSKPAVSKWKKGGFLVMVDGKVDVEQSDRKLKEFKLGRFSREGASELAPPASHDPAHEAPVEESPAHEAPVEESPPPSGDEDALRNAAQAMADLAARGLDLLPYDEAIRLKENYLALLRQLEYETKSGALIPLESAESVLFEEFRGQRDAWLNWPTRVGPMLAVDLGLDAARVTQALSTYVHQHIAQLGDPEGHFDGGKD